MINDPIHCNYIQIKNIAANRQLPFNYSIINDIVRLFIVDTSAQIVYLTEFSFQDSNYIDFQQNIQPTAASYSSVKDGITDILGQYIWPENSSKASRLVTQIIHRKQLIHKPFGFYFTTNTSANGSYFPHTRTINVDAVISSNQLQVSSIEEIAPYFTYLLSDGTSSEYITVVNIDFLNKIITLAQNLTNTYSEYSSLSLTFDKVMVKVQNGETIIDYYITNNNEDVNLQGIDIQGMKISGTVKYKDIFSVNAWHPAYGENISLMNLMQDFPLSENDVLLIKSPTTLTINTGLILRLKYIPADSQQRIIVVSIFSWSM